MVVVLPAPLGPSNAKTSPGWTSKLMSSTATKSPYRFESPVTATDAINASPAATLLSPDAHG